MLCKCYWIVLYIVHVTAFCLGGRFFSGHGVLTMFRTHGQSHEQPDYITSLATMLS